MLVRVCSRESGWTELERSGCSSVARSVPFCTAAVTRARFEGAVLAGLDPVDDVAGVLADEVVVALGHLDRLEHDVEAVDAVGVGLGRPGPGERVLQVGREDLERADVELLGGLFDERVDGVGGVARAVTRWSG